MILTAENRSNPFVFSLVSLTQRFFFSLLIGNFNDTVAVC